MVALLEKGVTVPARVFATRAGGDAIEPSVGDFGVAVEQQHVARSGACPCPRSPMRRSRRLRAWRTSLMRPRVRKRQRATRRSRARGSRRRSRRFRGACRTARGKHAFDAAPRGGEAPKNRDNDVDQEGGSGCGMRQSGDSSAAQPVRFTYSAPPADFTAALRHVADANPGRDIVVVAQGARLPFATDERLAKAALRRAAGRGGDPDVRHLRAVFAGGGGPSPALARERSPRRSQRLLHGPSGVLRSAAAASRMRLPSPRCPRCILRFGTLLHPRRRNSSIIRERRRRARPRLRALRLPLRWLLGSAVRRRREHRPRRGEGLRAAASAGVVAPRGERGPAGGIAAGIDAGTRHAAGAAAHHAFLGRRARPVGSRFRERRSLAREPHPRHVSHR